jgi:hypothetical protein
MRARREGVITARVETLVIEGVSRGTVPRANRPATRPLPNLEEAKGGGSFQRESL